MKKKIYFAGKFQFMYKDYSREKLAQDYRARLLGDVRLLLTTPRNPSKSVSINGDADYIGPFYFYDEGTSAQDIVLNEFNMVESSTDVYFLLDNDSCPGTVSELIHAAFLHKSVHIFYVKTLIDDGEPENEIDSKQWYPIQMTLIVNPLYTDVQSFSTYNDAAQAIINIFNK